MLVRKIQDRVRPRPTALNISTAFSSNIALTYTKPMFYSTATNMALSAFNLHDLAFRYIRVGTSFLAGCGKIQIIPGFACMV